MKKKGYLQISFAWLFAIIIGAVIIFLAIYFSTRLINIEQNVQDAKTGTEIGVLLNPLETSFESGKSNSLKFPVETRIYNKCKNNSDFGKQIIQVSQKNFNQWSETNIDVGFENKYIFSEQVVEGELFYVFSKPFEFPFKVSDLILLTSSETEYCFVNPPEEIEEELLALNQKNLLVENCSGDEIEVCFSGVCDIKINLEAQSVTKNEARVYFEGDALMYAAVFSDADIYECQLQRLMKRLDSLAILYYDKSVLISSVGCDANNDLVLFSNLVNNYDSSSDLSVIYSAAEKIEDGNIGSCKLW